MKVFLGRREENFASATKSPKQTNIYFPIHAGDFSTLRLWKIKSIFCAQSLGWREGKVHMYIKS